MYKKSLYFLLSSCLIASASAIDIPTADRSADVDISHKAIATQTTSSFLQAAYIVRSAALIGASIASILSYVQGNYADLKLPPASSVLPTDYTAYNHTILSVGNILLKISLAVKSWVSTTKYSSGVDAKPETLTQNFKDFEPLGWSAFSVGAFANAFYQHQFSNYFESPAGLTALISGPLSSQDDARKKAQDMAAIVKKGPFWGSIDAICIGTAALAHAYIRYAESTMKERAHNHYQRLQNGTV